MLSIVSCCLIIAGPMAGMHHDLKIGIKRFQEGHIANGHKLHTLFNFWDNYSSPLLSLVIRSNYVLDSLVLSGERPEAKTQLV